jgi:NAD-dependent deacetylase
MPVLLSDARFLRYKVQMVDPLLAEKLHACRNLVVFTGAGMSAESGIPTFRDAQTGLWAKFNPAEVASSDAFRNNPQLVWDWYVHRAEFVRKAKANAGHLAVARLQDLVPQVTVITQNIDGLHQRAGSRDVLELHGSLHRLKAFVDTDEMFAGDRSPVICHACNGYAIHEHMDPYVTREDLAAIELKAGPVPRCPCCGALLRPDIVWFGEPLDIDILEGAMLVADQCDAMICIGSSLEVQPAASIPFRAKWGGALVIEINPEPTDLSGEADVFLQGKAAEIVPALIEQVWGT